MILPLTNAQRVKRFGRFSFRSAPKPGNPERIEVLGDWPSKNIVRVPCPELAPLGLTACLLHRDAAESFVKLWRAWRLAGMTPEIQSWNGSYVTRYKRGKAGGGIAALSNHAWGTAFDVNARLYPLGREVPADDVMRHLAGVAHACGWFWGGDFRSRPDGMHFEYVGS